VSSQNWSTGVEYDIQFSEYLTEQQPAALCARTHETETAKRLLLVELRDELRNQKMK